MVTGDFAAGAAASGAAAPGRRNPGGGGSPRRAPRRRPAAPLRGRSRGQRQRQERGRTPRCRTAGTSPQTLTTKGAGAFNAAARPAAACARAARYRDPRRAEQPAPRPPGTASRPRPPARAAPPTGAPPAPTRPTPAARCSARAARGDPPQQLDRLETPLLGGAHQVHGGGEREQRGGHRADALVAQRAEDQGDAPPREQLREQRREGARRAVGVRPVEQQPGPPRAIVAPPGPRARASPARIAARRDRETQLAQPLRGEDRQRRVVRLVTSEQAQAQPGVAGAGRGQVQAHPARVVPGDLSLWLDEVHTYNDSRDGFGEQIKFYKENPTFLHPPLFFVLTHLFYPFSKPERDLRIIPLIAGTLSIPMIYLLARSLAPQIAIPCLIAQTFMAYHISLSQDGRSYALLMFFGMASLYFFIQHLKTSKKKYLIFTAFFYALLFYTSYSSVPFILFSQILWFYKLEEHQKTPPLSSFLILTGLTLLFILPWITFVVSNYKGQIIMDPTHKEDPGPLWSLLYGILHDWVPFPPLIIASTAFLILTPCLDKAKEKLPCSLGSFTLSHGRALAIL